MKLTTTQETALEVLKKELTGDCIFGNKYFSETLGKNLSDATLHSLATKGFIKVLDSFESTYTVRGNFGRGIRYQKQEICVRYQLVA